VTSLVELVVDRSGLSAGHERRSTVTAEPVNARKHIFYMTNADDTDRNSITLIAHHISYCTGAAHPCNIMGECPMSKWGRCDIRVNDTMPYGKTNAP